MLNNPNPEPTPEVLPSTPEERGLAMLCHLGGAFTSVIVPFVIWRKNRWRSRFLGGHSQEALNFQLTMLLALLGTGVLAGLTWTAGVKEFVLLPLAVLTVNFIYAVLATLAARRSQAYRYPPCIHFVND